MHVLRLDHVTINSVDLPATLEFYEYFLGLRPGWRPPFNVGGAWLYPDGGDYPILHVIEVDKPAEGGKFDHFAFRGSDLPAYLAKLKARGGWYRATPVPDTQLIQVHHYDPNNVFVEVNFFDERLDPSEVRDDNRW